MLFSVFATAKQVKLPNNIKYVNTTEAFSCIPGVLAVFAERRKDSFGPYVRLMSVTLN
ncbi:DUF987 family protein [Escherichia coli]|nr:DUF987 family protein [Escherichia coli]